jgi:beta-aspartyl-peptidase (threonine type)
VLSVSWRSCRTCGAGRSPAEAAREAVALLARRVQGTGGLILVGPAGEPGFAHNTQVMSRAWVRADGTIEVGL